MDRILGQDRAVDALRRSLRSGRVHHAWIFSGPRGVGEFTTALAFAGILLDPDAVPDGGGDVRSDPGHRTARLLAAGTHPDLHVIRKELALVSDVRELERKKLTNIPIDLLREHLLGGRTGDDKYREAPAYRKASLGHAKVFIIDEAELLDHNGQHALLKTLEEPPPRTYLILVTDRAERLLPTIRSRCQQVRFGPLDAGALDAWFERVDLEAPAAERAWIEHFCAGAPGLAVLAADYGFAGWAQRFTPHLADLDVGVYPAALGAALAEFVESFADAWVKEHRNASKDAANKDGVRYVLSILGAHARTGLAEACASGDDPDRWLRAIDLLRETEAQIAANVNLKQALENLVVQWATAPTPVG